MSAPFQFKFRHQTLWLSPARCIFWEEESAMILSDLHFGKSGHFRKSGIGIPQTIFKDDLQKLFSQIQFFKPKILLIVGDMFHSSVNKEIEFFFKWRNDIPKVDFCLIKGNHDILSEKLYKKANISVFENKLALKEFCFVHDINSSCDNEKLFTFTGHLHPGIRLEGIGKQSMMLPCFYFGKDYAVLPAFSAFTGMAKIKPAKGDKVFALLKDEILPMQ